MNLKEQNLFAKNLIGKVVKFKDTDCRGIDESGTYLQPEMFGRVVNFYVKYESENEKERVWSLTVDVREFKDHNDTFQSHNWYLQGDSYPNKTGTAYEAGQETEVIEIYLCSNGGKFDWISEVSDEELAELKDEVDLTNLYNVSFFHGYNKTVEQKLIKAGCIMMDESLHWLNSLDLFSERYENKFIVDRKLRTIWVTQYGSFGQR